MPTMLRWEEFLASLAVILPDPRVKYQHALTPFFLFLLHSFLHSGMLNMLSLTSSDQVGQQVTPFCPELVGACQAAVTSNHTQVGDAQLDQVVSGLCASLLGAKVLTAGATYHGAALSFKKTSHGAG